MPLRNPFARRPVVVTDIVNDHDNASAESHPDFERVDTVGSKASSALSIRSSQSHDNGEYKMSGMSAPKPDFCALRQPVSGLLTTHISPI